MKDLKAQANKAKRDARKLKKVQALQKENEEKEKIRQKKLKEKEETNPYWWKQLEECNFQIKLRMRVQCSKILYTYGRS